jgi:aminopeptidase C
MTSTSTSAPQRIYPAIEKLWPQLQALIEPYGLRRKDSEGEIIKGDNGRTREQQVEKVRREADDLRDAVEEAQAEQRSKKSQ